MSKRGSSTLADDALRVAAGASTIGEDRGAVPDPAPEPGTAHAPADTTSAEGPGFALEAAPASGPGETPARTRKTRTPKPRPVVFHSGELVTLNAVEISLDDFRSIRDQVETAFLDAFGSEPNAARSLDRVRRFFACLFAEPESRPETGTP